MSPEQWGVEAKADAKTIAKAVAAVTAVKLVDEVVDYIAALIRGTRDVADIESGASPRAGAMLARRGAGAGGNGRARFRDPGRRQGAGSARCSATA